MIGGDGRVARANRAFNAIFGDVTRARVPALDDARATGELAVADRLFSVRFDAVGGSVGEVVTLNDITAAHQALAAERSISRTLQLTLLPPRLPSDPRVSWTRGTWRPSAS